MQCFNFTLTTEYASNFRQTSTTSVTTQPYVTPTNNVVVIKKWEQYVVASVLCVFVLVL